MATSLPWSFCWAGGRGERGVAMSSLRLRAIAATPRWQKTNRSEWPWSPSRRQPYVLFAAASGGSTRCVGSRLYGVRRAVPAPSHGLHVAWRTHGAAPNITSAGFFTTNCYKIRLLLIEPNCQLLNDRTRRIKNSCIWKTNQFKLRSSITIPLNWRS